MKQLRPYQQAALDSVSDHFRNKVKRVLLCAPCGSGKSFMGSNAALMAARNGKRVLWVAHRSELVDQAAKELKATTGMEVGVFQGSRKQNPNARIQVASIQTLIRREEIPPATFVIGDEAHRMLAKQWHALLETYSDAHFLYLTATPERGDGKPMGDLADVIVPTVQPSELIDEGVLTPCEIIAPNDEVAKGLADDPTEAYLRWGNGRRAIFFCQTKEHARRTCERLTANGVPNGLVTDETPWSTRKMIYSKVANGTIRALVNVMVATEGLDIPALEVCVIARTMGNATMFVQVAGRVMRSSPGKESGLLIDLKGVVNTFGSPEADRHYHLDGEEAVTLDDKGASKRLKCSSCGSLRTGAICPVCQMAHSTERPAVPDIIPTSMEVKAQLERSDEAAAFYIRTLFNLMNQRRPRFPSEAGMAFRREFGTNPPSTWISMFLDFFKGNLPPKNRPDWWPKDVDLPGKYRVSSDRKEIERPTAAE